jgi:hypothetical protein
VPANENTCNMKHLLQHTSKTCETFETYLATYVYSHCNICNIRIKHSQHTSETAKTFETYTYNIHVEPLQHTHLLDKALLTCNTKTLVAT